MYQAGEQMSKRGIRGSQSDFFSSRRRHTRYWRDWSSDVCSSDLPLAAMSRDGKEEAMRFRTTIELGGKTATGMRVPEEIRSEERRVGKERRSRWSPYH